ncbi:unnamed protein product [Caretta caretta]
MCRERAGGKRASCGPPPPLLKPAADSASGSRSCSPGTRGACGTLRPRGQRAPEDPVEKLHVFAAGIFMHHNPTRTSRNSFICPCTRTLCNNHLLA